MIKQLRKRHLQIWLVLALILPIGIVVAWTFIPVQPTHHLLQPQQPTILPKLIQSIQKGNYTINIRCTGNDSAYQVEFINRIPLTAPSLLIYSIREGAKTIDEHQLLGRIESRGHYYFPLPEVTRNQTSGFILYDFIRQK